MGLIHAIPVIVVRRSKEDEMKLSEALNLSSGATKHVDVPVPGTYTVIRANPEAGYYENFQRDDPKQQLPCRPFYFGYPLDDDPLAVIASEDGEDGWEAVQR